jgi:hypothetical protein
MPKIDEAEKLARELCERDGFVWEFTALST